MNTNRTSGIGNLMHRAHTALVQWPEHFRAWRARAREDPSASWLDIPLKVGIWVLLGFLLVLGIRGCSAFTYPVAGDQRRESATSTATLFVACTKPNCLAAFMIRKPMTFTGWPMICETCGGESVYRAKICAGCRRWYAVTSAPAGVPGDLGAAVVTAGDVPECPHCAAAERKARKNQEQKRRAPTDPDDAEDPWGKP